MPDSLLWPVPPASPPSRVHLAAFAVTVAALTVLGFVASWLIGFAAVMVSDGCVTSTDTRFICSDSGQQTVAMLPWLGFGAALLVSLVGAAIARRHRRSPFLALPVAVLAYALPVVIVVGIAAAP